MYICMDSLFPNSIDRLCMYIITTSIRKCIEWRKKIFFVFSFLNNYSKQKKGIQIEPLSFSCDWSAVRTSRDFCSLAMSKIKSWQKFNLYFFTTFCSRRATYVVKYREVVESWATVLQKCYRNVPGKHSNQLCFHVSVNLLDWPPSVFSRSRKFIGLAPNCVFTYP
jgi:hypothetical protein